MLKPLLPMFRTDLSVCLKDIAEKKTGHSELKPIVDPMDFPVHISQSIVITAYVVVML